MSVNEKTKPSQCLRSVFKSLKFCDGWTSIILLLLLSATSCQTLKTRSFQKKTTRLIRLQEEFKEQFTGFCLYDLDEQAFLINHHENQKFTPASNVKLLTMYATLHAFPDSLPSLLYHTSNTGQLIVQPAGNPTLLYEPVADKKIINLLKSVDTLFISWPEPSLAAFGAGWAWDDYPFDFQVERAWWPIYGNRVQVSQTDSTVLVSPRHFEASTDVSIDTTENLPARLSAQNSFHYLLRADTSRADTSIPFLYSNELFEKLLSDTLDLQISVAHSSPAFWDTLYSHHVDTVLKHMLKPSDNFLAEQLLIQAAWTAGFSDIADYIDFFINENLQGLDEIVWKDGSGLSRYNLISPRSLVILLKKSVDEFGWSRVTHLLPAGGEGTLKKWYLSDEPYLFAKTGTLSNNHNLSGFLITKSGKKLIFSFMNNHYTRPTEEVKQAMQRILLHVRETY